MKDLLNKNFLLIIFAAIGYLISLMAAIIDFSSIANVIITPVISAFVWVSFGFIVKILLKRFIPELHEALFNYEQEEIEGETVKGNNLDVTVGDDEDSSGASSDSFSMDDFGSSAISSDITASTVVPEPDNFGDEHPVFEQDNKTMAKAVQTVLRKDKK